MIVKVLVNIFNYSKSGVLIKALEPREAVGAMHDGRIYTNHHVIQDAPTAYVKIKKKSFLVKVLATSEQDDVSILETPKGVEDSGNKSGLFLKNFKKKVNLEELNPYIFRKRGIKKINRGDSGSPIFKSKKLYTLASCISKGKLYSCGAIDGLGIFKQVEEIIQKDAIFEPNQ